MARRISSRLLITGKLIARTPLHVGGTGGNVDTDLALAINGKGEYYIPGTSLAGPLRAWLENDQQESINDWWGYQVADQGQASHVFIEDGFVIAPEGKQIKAEIRDGVGIDRVTGAAANQIKYDRAVLPRGTRVGFTMTVELPADTIEQSQQKLRDKIRVQTSAVLQGLQSGEIRFGAAKTRGMGRIEVHNLEVREQGFLTRKDMLKTLRDESDQPEAAVAPTTAPQPRLTVRIKWQPRGPLMVKAEGDGIAVDMLPLVSAIDEQLTFVLPGSSIKGAFRSQAERIVRTVLGLSAPKPVADKQDFIDQVELHGTRQNGSEDRKNDASLIGWLFGIAGRNEEEEKEEDQRTVLPGLGALMVDDCYAECRIEEQEWGAVEQATNERELRGALDAAQLSQAQQAFHVAIDRWLGSAADGFLYTVLEPHGIVWEEINLTLDLSRIPQDQEKLRSCAVMCLLLVLRDFASGRIPIGFGTNRGMGAVDVTGITIIPRGLDGILTQLQQIRIESGRLAGLSDDLRASLNRAWAQWTEENAL
ncbi:MAG: hypothetical protein DMF61_18575 [Blastocatellia bacterium AA13]|nr:MAG: hypothetical protein DMF61_18575 [Blastocatellia bacterium AA13]